MGSNSFGNLFRIMTWGESHGKSIGVVIDGCPAGLPLSQEDIQIELDKRAPGKTPLTTPRKEEDRAEILSGLFEGKTTGAPISILIPNRDADSSKYEPIKDILRPGHANFTYLTKYGIFDYRGGGRASARETASRVAAGAVAKKLLGYFGIKTSAYLKQVGNLLAEDVNFEEKLTALIAEVKEEGDSIAGIVEFKADNMLIGLGDPVYDKLEASLAKAMMSLPASKGFEMGDGFSAIAMKGSEHNDIFTLSSGKIETETNHAGGTLGGISNGMPLIGRVIFKPTSSIAKPQPSLTTKGEQESLQLPPGSRHDPCVAIRAVPVVEAMLTLVLVDALLMNRSARLE